VWNDDDVFNPDFYPVGTYDDAVAVATDWGFPLDNVVNRHAR
jgi:hypothetical protein